MAVLKRKLLFIFGLILLLSACQLPVSGSNAEENNSETAILVDNLAQDEHQNTSSIDFSFSEENIDTLIVEVPIEENIEIPIVEVSLEENETVSEEIEILQEEILEVEEVEPVVTVPPVIVNHLPQVSGEALSINEDTSIVLKDLLSNDADLDEDQLTINHFTQGSQGGIVERIEGEVLRYSPVANFNGEENFSYFVSDGSGELVKAEVIISVSPVNDIPVAQSDNINVKQDQLAVLNILDNDGGVGDSIQISLVSQASNGEVSIRKDGSVVYMPNNSYFGKDEFVYKITDQNDETSIASVSLHVVCENNCASQFLLSWKASQSANIVGYNVYVGSNEDELDSVFELGNTMQFAHVVEEKGAYYFAVSAINSQGIESERTSTILGVF